MKKPKDVEEIASRLHSAATTPLVMSVPEPAPVLLAAEPERPVPAAKAAGKRKGPQRSTVPVFLRLSPTLYEQCDKEAVRRTKATGRGVTIQQVILDRLEGTSA